MCHLFINLLLICFFFVISLFSSPSICFLHHSLLLTLSWFICVAHCISVWIWSVCCVKSCCLFCVLLSVRVIDRLQHFTEGKILIYNILYTVHTMILQTSCTSSSSLKKGLFKHHNPNKETVFKVCCGRTSLACGLPV